MICIGSQCDKCARKLSLIDNWKPACEAFPDGIPSEWYGNHDADVCNNGVGYVPDPEKVRIFEAGSYREQ